MTHMKTTRAAATAVLACLALGCSEIGHPDPGGITSVESGSPQQAVTGHQCPQAGDWFATMYTDCPTDFNDDLGTLSYTYSPSVNSGILGDPTKQNLVVTTEVRYSPNGYGVRYLGGEDWDGYPGTITSDGLQPRYIDELTEIILVGHTAWCERDPAIGNRAPRDCWDDKLGAHYEVAICIANGPSDVCLNQVQFYEGESGGGFPVHNQLPVAGAITATKNAQASTATCVAYDLALTGYSDHESGPLTFTWSSEPASTGGSSGTAVTRHFCTAGPTKVRVLVEDSQGGMDVAILYLDVPAPVASVTVSPRSASVAIGESAQFTAEVRDAAGALLTGRLVTWRSLNSAVADVSSSGLVTGVAPGKVRIEATSEGHIGTATVMVTSDVTAPPLELVSFEIPQPATPGASCVHRVEVSGGATPYTYSWTINGSVYTGVTSDTFALSYTNAGTSYQVGVTVTDANGAFVMAGAAVDVAGAGSCPNPTPI